MKIDNDDYKNLVIITLPKTICVDLPIKINESLKNDIKFIVSRNESLAEYKIKKEIFRLFMSVNMCMNIKKRTQLFIRKFKLYIKQ